MDIPVNDGISEKTIKRVAMALSLGVDPKDIGEELGKGGFNAGDIHLALVAGDVYNRMIEKEYPLSDSDK